jgi:hypothetical protein
VGYLMFAALRLLEVKMPWKLFTKNVEDAARRT